MRIELLTYELLCPDGWTTSGFQHCSVWLKSEADAVNVSRAVVDLWNAKVKLLGEDALISLILAGDSSFFVESGEGTTLEDLAEGLQEQVLGADIPLNVQDGGAETTIKIGEEAYQCDCGSDKFAICGVGRYKCKGCGRFHYNHPPKE